MMRELVAVSACICPPVVGVLLALKPPRVGAPEDEPPAYWPPLMVLVVLILGAPELTVAGAALEPPRPAVVPAFLESAASAALKVPASFVASAFFKYTTWILPLARSLLGRSSFSISKRACMSLAEFAALRMMELLLGSAKIVVLYAVSLD